MLFQTDVTLVNRRLCVKLSTTR